MLIGCRDAEPIGVLSPGHGAQLELRGLLRQQAPQYALRRMDIKNGGCCSCADTRTDQDPGDRRQEGSKLDQLALRQRLSNTSRLSIFWPFALVPSYRNVRVLPSSLTVRVTVCTTLPFFLSVVTPVSAPVCSTEIVLASGLSSNGCAFPSYRAVHWLCTARPWASMLSVNCLTSLPLTS